MYIYIYVYIYMCVYIYIHTYMNIYIYIYIHTYMNIHVYLYVWRIKTHSYLYMFIVFISYLTFISVVGLVCVCMILLPKKNQQPQEIQKNFACGKILLALSGWKPLNTLTWKDPTIKWWQFWWENLWKVCTLWWFDIVTYKMAHV